MNRIATNRAAALALAALLTGLLSGCGTDETDAAADAAPAEPARNVRVLEVAVAPFSEYFEISGPVAPVRGTDLSAEESGAVVALAADKGQTVTAGQLLIEQDRTLLAAERDAAAAQYRAQAFNLDKTRQLFEAGKISRLELLNTEAACAQAQALAVTSRRRWERAGIAAPFAGVVADRYVELGQLVLPGTVALRVIDPSVLKLEGYLTAEQVGWVRTGQPARVVLEDGAAPVPATVAWVGYEADRMTGKFKIELEIPNLELNHRSGVIGRARLAKGSPRQGVSIPRDAVLADRAGAAVFVVRGERAVRRAVRLGPGQGMMVTVVEGLAAGDQLVVRGQRELRDGARIAVTERTDAADGSLPTDPAVVTRDAAGSRLAAPEGEDAR